MCKKTVLVVGATGSIGRLVVEEAVRQGYAVRALVRTPSKARRFPAQVEVISGDVTRPETLSTAVDGIDAIVFTLGSDGAGKAGAESIDYGGVRNVLRALGSRSARIALMTSIGVTNRTGSYNRSTEAHDWKRRSERLVRASGLPYTIVRPGWFDYNSPDEHQSVFLQGDTRQAGDSSDGVIARSQIAEVLVHMLLRFNRGSRKPSQPRSNFIFLVGGFECLVIALSFGEDRSGQRYERRLAKTLCQRFLGEGASDPAVAVFKWMDGFEIEMRDPRSRQRGQRFGTSGRGSIEPSDETLHLHLHPRGWRCFKVGFGFVDCPRDYLHRVPAGPISPDIFKIPSATDKHPMPCKQTIARKRCCERAVKIDHHLCNSLFRRFDAAVVRLQSELPADRGLHAGAIKHLAFDL